MWIYQENMLSEIYSFKNSNNIEGAAFYGVIFFFFFHLMYFCYGNFWTVLTVSVYTYEVNACNKKKKKEKRDSAPPG